MFTSTQLLLLVGVFAADARMKTVDASNIYDYGVFEMYSPSDTPQPPPTSTAPPEQAATAIAQQFLNTQHNVSEMRGSTRGYIQFVGICDVHCVRIHFGNNKARWEAYIKEAIRFLGYSMNEVGFEFTLLYQEVWTTDRIGLYPHQITFGDYVNKFLDIMSREYYKKGTGYDAAYLFTGLSWASYPQWNPILNTHLYMVARGTLDTVCTDQAGGMISLTDTDARQTRTASAVRSNIAHCIGNNFGLVTLEERRRRGETCVCTQQLCIMSTLVNNYPPFRWSNCSMRSFEVFNADPPSRCIGLPALGGTYTDKATTSEPTKRVRVTNCKPGAPKYPHCNCAADGVSLAALVVAVVTRWLY